MSQNPTRSVEVPDGTNVGSSISWPFRAINVVSVVSLIALGIILFAPIPFFRGQSTTSIINLDLNDAHISRAIKILPWKFADNDVLVQFSTYNNDHIIGDVIFGDTLVGHDENIISRLVYSYYDTTSMKVPYLLNICDVYDNAIVLKKYFILDKIKKTYKSYDSGIYVVPNTIDVLPTPVHISLATLLNYKHEDTFSTSYECKDFKVVTEYRTRFNKVFGDIIIGNNKVPYDKDCIDRRIIVTNNVKESILSVEVTSFYGNKSKSQRFFVESGNLGESYHDFESFKSEYKLSSDGVDDSFGISRYEPYPKNVVDLTFSIGTIPEGVSSATVKHMNTVYFIAFGEKCNVIGDVFISKSQTVKHDPKAIDRLVLLSFNEVESTLPTYYIFTRSESDYNCLIFKPVANTWQPAKY